MLDYRPFKHPFRTLANRFFNNVSDIKSVEAIRARLLYQSTKRGILENDILIGLGWIGSLVSRIFSNFARSNLSGMDERELLEYDRIINGQHMEWDLYYYFTGKQT